MLFIPIVSFGQSLPSDWSEKSVRNFFNKKGFKGIEGIYSFNHSLHIPDRSSGRYYSYPNSEFWRADGDLEKGEKFAIIYSKNDFGYIGYRLGGKTKYTQFILQESATNGLFDVKWSSLAKEITRYNVKNKYSTQRFDVHENRLNDFLDNHFYINDLLLNKMPYLFLYIL